MRYVFLVLLLIIINSCAEITDTQFDNPKDPLNYEYIPNSIQSLKIAEINSQQKKHGLRFSIKNFDKYVDTLFIDKKIDEDESQIIFIPITKENTIKNEDGSQEIIYDDYYTKAFDQIVFKYGQLNNSIFYFKDSSITIQQIIYQGWPTYDLFVKRVLVEIFDFYEHNHDMKFSVTDLTQHNLSKVFLINNDSIDVTDESYIFKKSFNINYDFINHNYTLNFSIESNGKLLNSFINNELQFKDYSTFYFEGYTEDYIKCVRDPSIVELMKLNPNVKLYRYEKSPSGVVEKTQLFDLRTNFTFTDKFNPKNNHAYRYSYELESDSSSTIIVYASVYKNISF